MAFVSDYSRQIIDEDDVAAVISQLKSQFLTTGPTVDLLEMEACEYIGCDFAIAVNSATSALHLGLLAMDVSENDIVWTVPNTFISTVSTPLMCRASVKLVDICCDTFNVDLNLLRVHLELARKSKSLPKVFIAVHFGGVACDMAGLAELGKEFGFMILEDASHALSATYNGIKVGSCVHSSACIFSFHPVKPITTGEGGLLVTNDPGLSDRVRLMRSHGVVRDTNIEEPWFYEQRCLGYNYRMPDLNAALGLSQLKKIDGLRAKRSRLDARYRDLIDDICLPVRVQSIPSSVVSSHHLFVVKLLGNNIGQTRLELFRHLKGRGIGVNVHYIPVHLHPYMRKMLGYETGAFPICEEYYAGALSLPLHPLMDDMDVDCVVREIQMFLSRRVLRVASSKN